MNSASLEAALADRGVLIRFDKGETLFREGADPLGVYLLHRGKVDLLFAPRCGVEKSLREIGPGHTLGLSAVVARRVHDCTAIATSDVEVAFMARDEFLAALAESPAVWFGVLRILSSEVNAAYDDMRLLAAR